MYAGIAAKNSTDVADPRVIEKMGYDMSDEELFRSTTFCSKWSDVIDLISKYQELGVTQIALNSGADKKMIRTFATKILPHFKKK